MENNLIEKYELINGKAVIDNEYNVVTGNEEMYRFMGFNIDTSILEVIHQVDADDFIEVCTSLQPGLSKNMVLRMRRNDNSYRWMLLCIKRCESQNNWNAENDDGQQSNEENSSIPKMNQNNQNNQNNQKYDQNVMEYWELDISDIITLKDHANSMQNSVMDFRHLMAMENELFFTYDFSTQIFVINHFIDNEIRKIFEMPIALIRTSFIDNGYIALESKNDFLEFCQKVEEGCVSFSYHMKANFFSNNHIYTEFEFKGSSIYTQMKPRKVVGSIKNVDASNNHYNIKTYEYSNNSNLMSYNEVRDFAEKNIKYNPDSNFTMILMQVDHLEEYITMYGNDFLNQLFDTIIQTSRKMLGYRGVICKIRPNLYSIAVKELNNEACIRAFIQSLRSSIAWNYRKLDDRMNITFSIGIASYPFNDTVLSRINRKLVRALELAIDRGGDRYIIYKEYLHGELEN